MNNQNIIEITNVSVYRQQNEVFSDLSIAIPEGCNTAILGPNGAGKSTLLKLLSRELYPVQREGSSVRIYGQERWDVWALRAHFGLVSQDLQQQYMGNVRGLSIILSGYYSSNNIWDHQEFREADVERAYDIMHTLGITELKERLYSTLSTGEQRRFLLGRALVHDPDALVLDEPTSGLDVKACFQYLAIIRGLMQAGKTIVLVTHHIHEIPPEVSRVVLLKEGHIVADGEKSDICTDANLSMLFDTSVHLVEHNGYYQAMPGSE
jgi:iron complex transport system ATP-binding protein